MQNTINYSLRITTGNIWCSDDNLIVIIIIVIKKSPENS